MSGNYDDGPFRLNIRFQKATATRRSSFNKLGFDVVNVRLDALRYLLDRSEDDVVAAVGCEERGDALAASAGDVSVGGRELGHNSFAQISREIEVAEGLKKRAKRPSASDAKTEFLLV